MAQSIEQLILAVLAQPFSDLHLRSAHPPLLRLHGELVAVDDLAPIRAQAIDAWRSNLLTVQQQQRYHDIGDADCAADFAEVRLRINFFRSIHGPACAIRRLAARVPTLDFLSVPSAVQAALTQRNGLILVTGPTGSGKSTTLAAMIQSIHEQRSVHTITLEDPIEYLHQARHGLITQRQIGRDVSDFASGLRAALREDPDVILVGEMRDAETIGLALTAAETGHLVLATLHTRSAQGSITRMIDSLPVAQQAHARVQLADALRLTLAQELWPRRDRPGRVAAFEVMLCTPAVAHLIREQKTFQIDNVMQTSRQDGMQTMAAARAQLRQRGLIAHEAQVT